MLQKWEAKIWQKESFASTRYQIHNHQLTTEPPGWALSYSNQIFMNVGTILKYMYVKILKRDQWLCVKRILERLLEKEKMVVTSIFSFPTMFSTVSKIEVVLAMVNLLCENAFSLVWFKILSLGKGVMISLDNCQACPGKSFFVIHCFHYIDYKYIAARLSVYPNYAGMFGGKVIDISGPCFPTSPRCRFTDVSEANYF